MEDDALAQRELCAVAVDLDDVLPDEAGVGDALAVRHLLGDGLHLGVVAGVGDHRLGDGQVHGGVLQWHMGAAVEGGAHACVGAEHMDRQARVGGGHIDLVIDAAAGEGAEGVEIHLLAGGGKACAHTGGVGLGDARLIGPVGVGGHQLLGVDAAHQVAVHVAHGLVRGHHVLQRQGDGVPAGAAVLFMLGDQFPFHFRTSSNAFSAAAMASCHASSLGWEECSRLGSAKVAPLPLMVSSTMQEGTPFLS